jgi:uncharacterized protein (DUF433 family)
MQENLAITNQPNHFFIRSECDDVIWVDSERLSGAPCFKGTRVPIANLFDYLEGGDDIDDFLDAFEGVSREQVVKVLELARENLLKGILLK